MYIDCWLHPISFFQLLFKVIGSFMLFIYVSKYNVRKCLHLSMWINNLIQQSFQLHSREENSENSSICQFWNIWKSTISLTSIERHMIHSQYYHMIINIDLPDLSQHADTLQCPSQGVFLESILLFMGNSPCRNL